jgi:hypothetical protein
VLDLGTERSAPHFRIWLLLYRDTVFFFLSHITDMCFLSNIFSIIQSSRPRPQPNDLEGDQVTYPRCKIFDQYFYRLPDEINLIIIKFALDTHITTLTKLFLQPRLCVPTTSSAPPLPPLFYVSRLFVESFQVNINWPQAISSSSPARTAS